MGNSSSQAVASQAPTQDVAVTSQPATQIPALDGTRDEEPQTLERVASTMDATVEDTVKRAKKERMKDTSRAKKKSVPQHTRGFAIQPSQEILDTQEEEQAQAGAGDGELEADGGEEIVASQSAEPESNTAAKRKAQHKKRRLPWHTDDAEPTNEDANLEPGLLEEIQVNTLREDAAPSTKQKKRKRKDIELERLQKDAEDFAPEIESTPKPKPAVKRQKRAKDIDRPETIEEHSGLENEDQDVTENAKPDQRTKAARHQEDGAAVSKDVGTGAAKSKAKRKKQPKAGAGLEDAEPADTVASNSTTRREEGGDSSAQLQNELQEADEEQAALGAENTAPSVGDREDPPADSIPTPPESPDAPAPDPAQADDNDVDEVQARDESSHEDDPAYVASAGASGDSPKAQPRMRSTNQTMKKRKRAPENAESDEEATPKEQSKKAEQKKVPTDDDEVSPKQRGQVQGTWSKEERARADEIFQDVVRVTAVPDWELKANIIDWKNPTPHLRQFKEELYEAFPKRSLKSIMRFCQRRYNAFDRGKWNEEQDQLLREAYELFPDQWTDISDHVGRFWEDCRMRWRDVLSREGAKAETGPWSREEELKLARAVKECRELVVKEMEDEELLDDPEKVDALISWKVVAEKMDNARSAKRCREKWARIKHQDFSTEAAPAVTQPIKNSKPSARLHQAEKEYQQCEAGDVYDMMVEICEAVPDTSRIFEHETTFWSVVAVRNPESKFSSSLRRKALMAAIEDYSCKAVREADTLAAKAMGVKRRMEAMERRGELELVRVYHGKVKAKKADVVKNAADVEEDPAKEKTKSKKGAGKAKDLAGDEAGPQAARKVKGPSHKPNSKPTKRSSAQKPKDKATYKSADLIVDSDADEDDEGAPDEGEVAQSPAGNSAPVGDEDDEEDSNDGKGGRRARQQTEEVNSLGSDSPRLDRSSFIEMMKGGKRVRAGGKKGGKKGKK